MPDRPATLHLHLHGAHLATLQQRRQGEPIRLTHTEQALDTYPGNSPVISNRLRVSRRAQDATAWLDGLLPEGPLRDVIAGNRGLVSSDTWAMIASLGRDVAGACIIVDPDRPVGDREPHVEPYPTLDHVAAAVDALPDAPLGVLDDSELSLAGMQDKLLLVRTDAGCGWGRPVGGYPSTHILKVDPSKSALRGVVEQEAAALAVAQRTGLTNISPTIVNHGDSAWLIVERYDRSTDGTGRVTRIHQEDLAQAAGVDTRCNGRRAKYESHGGPSLLTAAHLLRDGAQDVDEQLSLLVGAMVFTVLIGNSDAHAKNLSLVLDPPGAVQLAPLYDTVPTMLFPILAVRCAMMIGGVYDDLERVNHRALVYEVEGRRRWGITNDRAVELVDEWIDRVVQATVGDRVGEYVRRAADRLAR
jgi:serine/threonine-protein kinase HipA